MRKKRCWIFILLLILSLFPAVTAAAQQIPMKIGDYVVFGMYYDVPVRWRVVAVDEKGNPMILADRIIALKPYDAKGAMRENQAWPAPVVRSREQYGSNYWPDTNIRQWLNSYASVVEWVKSPPAGENVFMSYNPYGGERGFLADGNFSASERSAILVAEHRALVSAVDKETKQGGTEPFVCIEKIEEVMQNYDNSYYLLLKDGVFLPDVKEIHDLYLNENILGKDFFRAKPTPEAIENSTYSNPGLSSDQFWGYWLRTPYSGNGETVAFITAEGRIDYQSGYAYDGTLGVRPALWLNGGDLQMTGSGSENDPYVVKGSRKAAESNNKVVVISFGGILVVFLMIFTRRGPKIVRKRRR